MTANVGGADGQMRVTNDGTGSGAPAQVMWKRSLMRSQHGRGIPMAAVPRTAADRGGAAYLTQQPLRGSQHDYVSQHPPAAVAASPTCDLVA